MTPAGNQPATYRFVAQDINHCVTAESYIYLNGNKNLLQKF